MKLFIAWLCPGGFILINKDGLSAFQSNKLENYSDDRYFHLSGKQHDKAGR